MVRQAHHERKYENPFALSLSKGDLAKQGTFGAKLGGVEHKLDVLAGVVEIGYGRFDKLTALSNHRLILS